MFGQVDLSQSDSRDKQNWRRAFKLAIKPQRGEAQLMVAGVSIVHCPSPKSCSCCCSHFSERGQNDNNE